MALGTGKKTVLVVDDDPDARDALGQVLRREGFAVVTVPGGRAALEYLASGAVPDVALIDLVMPDVDGWSLVAELRELPRVTGLPIVVVSGAGPRTMARAPLADGHLQKPVDLDQLLALLRRLIAHRSSPPGALLGGSPASEPPWGDETLHALAAGRPASSVPPRRPLSQRMVVPVVLAVDCEPTFLALHQDSVARCGAVLKGADSAAASRHVAALRPLALIAPRAAYEREGRFLEVLGRSVDAMMLFEEECGDARELEARLRGVVARPL